ncbi:cupin domain-containing protein [Streptomyces sp. NPDC056656]|uniref:cupin domain-containing protein n=1 Tax=Streptomyces sp. NPDC056656 TaxID=3345895 RepID=UPI003683F52B
MNPTDEQTAAADTFRAGDHLALQAGAGTGRTTTLALLAQTTERHGRYLVYNRAIATDARTRFPGNITCKTAHAMAYAAVGHRYTRRLGAPRRPAWQTGHALGLTKPIRIGSRDVSQRALANAALRTVARFCHTADTAIVRPHVPRLRGLEDNGLHTQLADHIVPFARKAWTDLQHFDDGAVRFDHDHYLKIWALTQPRIESDFLLLDEAQDTNPVVEQVFLAQREHAQLVMVGDSAQAIYHWRGAKDVMTGFDGVAMALSQSFRFGPTYIYTTKLTAEQSNGAFGFVEASVPPGGGPAPHVHVHTDETLYLVSGELEFLDGDREFTARTGDLVFCPRGNTHRFTNTGLHPAKLVFMYTPGGAEGLFVEGGDEPRPGVQVQPWGPERIDGRMLGLLAKYDTGLPEAP